MLNHRHRGIDSLKIDALMLKHLPPPLPLPLPFVPGPLLRPPYPHMPHSEMSLTDKNVEMGEGEGP